MGLNLLARHGCQESTQSIGGEEVPLLKPEKYEAVVAYLLINYSSLCHQYISQMQHIQATFRYAAFHIKAAIFSCFIGMNVVIDTKFL